MSTRPEWQIPALGAQDRLVGGVASGVAAEIGVDPLWVRLGFVVLFAVGGWGGLLYLVLWGALSYLAYVGRGPTVIPSPKGRTHLHRMVGVGMVVFGLALLFGNLQGVRASVLWPVGVVVGGILVALERITPSARNPLPSWFPTLQIVGGVAAAVGVVAAVNATGLAGGSTPAFVAIAIVVGLVVLSAPWWWRLVTDLDTERQARVRSDERAEVTAHLHDSVLQTLALIQKGEDSQQMVNLARRQERELRNWLDPGRASRLGGSVRGRLDQMASDVEELHGVPVEVVSVGDVLAEGAVEAILAAANEAVVNAAKHSGAPRIDVFSEVQDHQIEVFIRDTGIGFAQAQVNPDRLGIRESIVGRMQRAGGTAQIRSDPGEGTEVELTMPTEPTPTQAPPTVGGNQL